METINLSHTNASLQESFDAFMYQQWFPDQFSTNETTILFSIKL